MQRLCSSGLSSCCGGALDWRHAAKATIVIHPDLLQQVLDRPKLYVVLSPVLSVGGGAVAVAPAVHNCVCHGSACKAAQSVVELGTILLYCCSAHWHACMRAIECNRLQVSILVVRCKPPCVVYRVSCCLSKLMANGRNPAQLHAHPQQVHRKKVRHALPLPRLWRAGSWACRAFTGKPDDPNTPCAYTRAYISDAVEFSLVPPHEASHYLVSSPYSKCPKTETSAATGRVSAGPISCCIQGCSMQAYSYMASAAALPFRGLTIWQPPSLHVSGFPTKENLSCTSLNGTAP